VIRVRPGQPPFMQKNVPKYTPDWMATISVWAEASRRDVTYALCNDRRSLLWFANQRAVEYHPTLVRAGTSHPTYLVLDLDPPAGDAFPNVVRAAVVVRQALTDAGLAGVVKTSGSKGLHVFVPLNDRVTIEEAAAGSEGKSGDAEGGLTRRKKLRNALIRRDRKIPKGSGSSRVAGRASCGSRNGSEAASNELETNISCPRRKMKL
jgi:hypothetical protein